jgi:hypothetical protein
LLIISVRDNGETMNSLLALFALVIFVQPCLAEECERLPKKAEKFIKAFEKKVRGAEYCRFRDIAHGDINGDGVADLVVIFNVEGACNKDKGHTPGGCGNDHETYLKAFLGKELREIPMLEIGGRGTRLISSVKALKGAVEVETLSYGEKDAMCCPTIADKAQFIIQSGKFIERHP